jgi:hypothetical protein
MLSVFTLHYLIGTAGCVEYCTERHELGLFTVDQMLEAFGTAGLSATYDENGITGRGLYLARAKP